MMPIVQTAKEQRILSDVRRTKAYQRVVIRDASRRLQDRVSGQFEPWSKTRMAAFYRTTVDDQPAILKVVTGKAPGSADIQYQALLQLALLASTREFRIPKPLVGLSGRSAYAMGGAEGTLLQAAIPKLIRSRNGQDLLGRCARRCGVALAQIHREWQSPSRPFGQVITDDLVASAPWHLSTHGTRLLFAAGSAADQTLARSSRLYFDFDPCNVFVDTDDPITLLDPPDVHTIGPIHWDLATFRVGLERAMWRPRSATLEARAIENLQETFTIAYETESGHRLGDTDDLLILLCEIARLAQLLLWWSSITRSDFGRGVARAAYARPMVWRAWQARRRTLERMLG
jgi:hypothetical protein